VPDAPTNVHLSVASSSSVQVTFWEPLSVNSAVVTKYKGKDQGPHSSAADMQPWQVPAARVGVLSPGTPRSIAGSVGSAAKPLSSHLCAPAQEEPGLNAAGQPSHHPNGLNWTEPLPCTEAELGLPLVCHPLNLHTRGALLSCCSYAPHPLKPDIFGFWENFPHPQLLTPCLRVLTLSDVAW